jgi:hypothetical protein
MVFQMIDHVGGVGFAFYIFLAMLACLYFIFLIYPIEMLPKICGFIVFFSHFVAIKIEKIIGGKVSIISIY